MEIKTANEFIKLKRELTSKNLNDFMKNKKVPFAQFVQIWNQFDIVGDTYYYLHEKYPKFIFEDFYPR